MTCECNWHLGMGPNLRCPEHGEENRRALLHIANEPEENALQYEKTILTMFLNFIQTKGAWPCVLEFGEAPKVIPVDEVLKLKDEFIRMLDAN